MNRNMTGSMLSVVAAALVLGCSTSSPQPATVPPEQARAGADSAKRQADMGTTNYDTSAAKRQADVRMPNADSTSQTQSGVTNSDSTSRLGAGVSEPTPVQTQPVMAKGDTLRKAETPAPR